MEHHNKSESFNFLFSMLQADTFIGVLARVLGQKCISDHVQNAYLKTASAPVKLASREAAGFFLKKKS